MPYKSSVLKKRALPGVRTLSNLTKASFVHECPCTHNIITIPKACGIMEKTRLGKQTLRLSNSEHDANSAKSSTFCKRRVRVLRSERPLSFP